MFCLWTSAKPLHGKINKLLSFWVGVNLFQVLTDLASVKGLYSSNPPGVVCLACVTDGSYKNVKKLKV